MKRDTTGKVTEVMRFDLSGMANNLSSQSVFIFLVFCFVCLLLFSGEQILDVGTL